MSQLSEMDDVLALSRLIIRCEHERIGWDLKHDITKDSREYRYQLTILNGPAHGTYPGRTATHAASRAMIVFDELKVGWHEQPA